MTLTLEGPPARNNLARSDAEARAGRVRDVAYELDFDLRAGSPTYRGRARIEFGLDAPGDPLFLDLAGRVTDLRIEGRSVPADHRACRLWLAPGQQSERMRLEVEFENAFDTSGDGFHRFVDPEDGGEYLYSNFQPFAAHRMFPCFDQPDLKATYRVRVEAPAGWAVVSAGDHQVVEELPDGRGRHVFAPTPRFSTYLLPLVAGSYVPVTRDHDGIRLGLWARRSMRPELERWADELFEVTAQGFDFYRRLFDQPYPFTKYDQLFVPEFNAGAMENVAAVTFHDSYLFRELPTRGQRLGRAEVVLHELAHMWFGDLVTTRWWDDLWLNESFATYISFLCLAEATRFTDAWRVFNGTMKPAAYRQDQMVTTHPIAADVVDTEAALGNFDAITYEKGAAVLKQLVASLGRGAFQDGIRTYFRRHAWGNATLADFLAALGEAAGRPLDEWARLWLRTPSINTVGATWSQHDGRVTELRLWQTAPQAHPVLRPHATEVALVGSPAAGPAVEVIPARIEAAQADVPGAIGRPAPLLVFPNHGDHDYALTSLDEVSLAYARGHLPELPDPLLRQQLWGTLWEMVRDARLPSPAFLAVVRRFCPGEPETDVVEAMVGHALTALADFVPGGLARREASALVATALEALQATGDADRRIIWARTAIAAAGSVEDLEPLLAMADGHATVAGFELDQEMRWGLAIRAAAHALPDAATRLAAETARDRSDRGLRARLRAETSRPDAGVKAEAWRRIHAEGYGSDYLTRSAMSGFQWPHQRELLLPFRQLFFERVREMYAGHDHAFARSYVRQLLPDRWAEPEVLSTVRTLAERLDEGEQLLRRHLEEVADELARRIRAHALAESAAGAAGATELASGKG